MPQQADLLGHDRPLCYSVWTDLGLAVDVQQVCQPVPGTVHAALDGTQGYAHDLGDLFVGQTLCSHQKQSLSLIWGSLVSAARKSS